LLEVNRYGNHTLFKITLISEIFLMMISGGVTEIHHSWGDSVSRVMRKPCV
jgi:hypothetical protein